MPNTYTWRELLSEVISDVHERRRIAEYLKINPVTLTRWAAYKSNPRPASLRQLLKVFPSQRQHLAELIAQEYPHIVIKDDQQEKSLPELPASFYARVLTTYTHSPAHLRTTSICNLILQQILRHLDPSKLGMGVLIAQCQTPGRKMQQAPSFKIRSLRAIYSYGTPPWHRLEHQTLFFGAESSIGHAAFSGYPIVVQTQEERRHLFPSQEVEALAKSSAAYPLLHSDRAAGVLYIASSQPNFFTATNYELTCRYAELLALAFEPYEFYNLCDFDLGILPSLKQQQAVISTFQRRITHKLIKAQQNGGSSTTRHHVEAQTWNEIEGELLYQTRA